MTQKPPSFRPVAVEANDTAERILRRVSPSAGHPAAAQPLCRCGRVATVRCRLPGRIWLACDNPAHHDGATTESLVT